ncbi:2',3'-cyclic-nucleotide 3'-phosphodiesterase isoform X1 [Procambarus clarkii]|uniref:2',3'-cyclic-nucleotide 3'-phosphodiesterase isoform X1 n=1 Tax=Procambarus clarkii TaxID=6728 RepID=UPI0037443CC0
MGKACSKVWNCCKQECPHAGVQPSNEDYGDNVVDSSSSSAALLDASHGPQDVSDGLSNVRRVAPCDTSTISQSREQLDNEDYLRFPILLDKKTIEYAEKSKVMIILKGLPGSGKSHIARRIQKVFSDCVVCSADSYFMNDGVYKFDRDRLKDAHRSCQEKACDAAQRGSHVIVIDNTNVKTWESKYYLDLTKKYNYTPLILEAQTPWAMDPKELAQKNSHGVPEEVLVQKVKDYEPVLPLYYWWFLNEADCRKVSLIAREWLEKALQVPSFFQDFSETTKLLTLKDMLGYYSRNAKKGTYNVLHTTASVTRRGKTQNGMDYIQSAAVRNSLGKCFDLHIIGYVVTPRTFGARVKLGSSELELWGMDDNEIETENAMENSSDNIDITCNSAEEIETSCHDTVTVIPSNLKSDKFCPTSGKGSRAHVTLGCASNIHPRTTGFDLINVVSCEQRVKEIKKSDGTEISDQKVETYAISEGTLRTYGDGIWVIYPEKEVIVSSLFSAFY